MDGDFFNPLIWNPMGVPMSGDSLFIDHAVNMNTDIYYSEGRITINSGASLLEDATDRNFWADGTGSLVNKGTFTTHNLAISQNAVLINEGDLANIDSLWNQGAFSNTQTATIYDFLNDQTGTFDNATSLTITNNMNNQGYVNNIGIITIANDFSNCNIQSMDALFINDGTFCITNDFTNCADDTLTGTGNYFIGGSSSNLGVFDGTFTFYTPSGTIGIPGTIGSGVTVTAGTCNLGIESQDKSEFILYPNPTTGTIHLSVNNVSYQLFDYTGKLLKEETVENHQVDLTSLSNGIYTLIIEGNSTKRFIKR